MTDINPPDPDPGHLHIYSDGSCIGGNPGYGGWAALLIYRTLKGAFREKMVSGRANQVTNQQMELEAAIQGLEAVKGDVNYTVVYTDSMYVVRGMKEWIDGWTRNGWRNSAGKPVKNRSYWERLHRQSQRFPRLTFSHVRGHVGIRGNERVDAEASRQSAALREVFDHVEAIIQPATEAAAVAAGVAFDYLRKIQEVEDLANRYNVPFTRPSFEEIGRYLGFPASHAEQLFLAYQSKRPR